MKPKALFLLTKKFPFSHQETYLFDELPFLTETFGTVTIVPYDEFDFKTEENRMYLTKNAELLKLNEHVPVLSLSEKLKREFYVQKTFLTELFFGREKNEHIKNRKLALSQLRHCYTSSLVLRDHIEKHCIGHTDVILYNYWLHRGVLISCFTKLLSYRKIHVVSRAHAYDLYHRDWLQILGRKLGFLPFEYFKIKACERIFSISGHGLLHFGKYFSKFKDKFTIARLGVTDQADKAALPAQGPITIVTCSGIDERKRMYRMPEILSKLNFDFKWVHFGSGAESDVQQVRDEIKKYGLEGKCDLKGRLPHHEIINYYRYNKADLFMNISTAEGIPVSLMEAASFSIPMLATRTVGNPEIVTAENGFLIDIDFNPEDVSRVINSFFANRSEVESKRKAARKTYEDLYSAEKNYNAFAQQLNSL